MTDSIWTRRLAYEDVPDGGLRVEISADDVTRAELARRAGLRNLPRLDAWFEIARKGHERLHVAGEVSAIVCQDCVVTLEAIEQNVIETIDLVFAAAEISLADRTGQASFALRDAEPPERLVGGAVDLGAIATEHFLLGIDPYPRKAGAVFETATAGNAVGSPFAALASLRKPPSGDPD